MNPTSFNFLNEVRKYDKNLMNGETAELLEPLLVNGSGWFNVHIFGFPQCGEIFRWIQGLYQYEKNSKLAKPCLE